MRVVRGGRFYSRATRNEVSERVQAERASKWDVNDEEEERVLLTSWEAGRPLDTSPDTSIRS
jgi:hypothetical protein